MFVAYSPPSVSSELATMTELVKCVEDYCNRLGPTAIVGDFNCPNIDWSNMLSPAQVVNKKLFNFVIGNVFSQVVTEPNRSNNFRFGYDQRSASFRKD